ncbi:MAG: nicotinate phosphoribosyltransferase, partial [Sphingobacteriaceae bacterium]
MSHLIHFEGTDTIPCIPLIKKYYGVPYGKSIGSTIAGSEHSVMCSFGKDSEYSAYERILEIYPSGNVSIVSDTYDYWKVITDYLPKLREPILARSGKVIIRPDSGDPELILLGDPNAIPDSAENLGTLRMIDQIFGSTLNVKGYKMLCPSIGIIYGDGMYPERIKRIMERCIQQGYATSNLHFGIGGILLQSHSRDDLGFAFKASSVTIHGNSHA